MTDPKLEIGVLYRFIPSWNTMTNFWIYFENLERAQKIPKQGVLLFLGEDYYSPWKSNVFVFLYGDKKCFCVSDYSGLFVKSLERVD
jgi:hypothetical protein